MAKEKRGKELAQGKPRGRGRHSSSTRSQRNISEREQQTQETLRQSDEHYRALAEQTLMGLVVIQDFHILFANNAFAEISGYSIDELLSLPPEKVQAMVHPEDQALVWGRFRNRLADKAVQPHYEYRGIRKDGTVCWLEMHAGRIDYGGKPAIQGAVIDITNYKRAEEAVRKSEEKHRKIFEEALDAIFIADAQTGLLIDCNRAACELVGAERSDLIGKHQRILHPPEEMEGEFSRSFREHLHAKEGKVVETQVITKKGEIKEVAIKANLLEFEGKKVLQGIFRDITERKQTEQALRQSEERYRQLAENAGEAIFVIQGGMIKFMNPKGEELSGYSIEELASSPFVKFIHPDDVNMVVDRNVRRLKGEPVPQTYEFRIIRKDRAIRWGELNAVPISWDNIPAVLCFMDDVTERKQAEEALRQSEERYRAILEEMQDSYFKVDLGGHITFINSAGCRHLGYSREELTAMSYKKFTAEDYIKPVFQIFNEVYRTGVPNKGFHWKIIRKDGSVAFIDASVAPLRDDKGEIIGFSSVGRDVTERRKMDEQLILTDRLASIGQLAAGIAHELNNPLTSVIGFSDLLLERDVPADVKEDLEIVNREAKRSVNIVKGLLTFAREQRTEKTLVQINTVIQGVLQIRAYEQRVSNIEVTTRFAPALPQVMGNGVQLQQVFINIIVNAEQAMTEGRGRGKLTIVTEQIGDMVRASITDDGPGISPDNMKRLFTPFFTTREVGKGTGLGLSICHGIVSEHGGKLYAESEPGRGATFVVELPMGK
jgi:two-component system NtrC family sensor kinase